MGRSDFFLGYLCGFGLAIIAVGIAALICTYAQVMPMPMEEPAAEVAPMRHGRWEKMLQNADGTADYECTACKGLIIDVPDDDEHPLCNYCPNCGAQMEADE